MDNDMDKGFKKKIINIWGTKYEIKHKNKDVINNNWSVYFGFSIFCCKQLFRKFLISTGVCMMIFLTIWEYIDRTILLCMYDSVECPFIYIGCYNITYYDEYVCVRDNNFSILFRLAIINLWYKFIWLLIIFLWFYLVILCFNYSISKYIEQIPTIENIL